MNCYRDTNCGPIQGIPSKKAENTVVFRGIKYADAARFEYPVQVTEWSGVYDASGFGSCSYQPRAFYDEEKAEEKAFYFHEFRRGETYTYSDGCQYLNIWAPEAAKDLPALFYIHGGGFTGGCGHEKHFEGEAWCQHGVVAVTINYRLGPLGFACLPELVKKDGHSGNYGLYDQLAALKWVRDNIAAFGGNPQKITVMGQSAGAMSVQLMVNSPMGEGLFSGAIMLSGGGVSRLFGIGNATMEELYPFWEAVKRNSGAASIEELKTMDARRLFQAWQKAKKEEKGAFKAMGPCRDGLYVTESGADALAGGRQRKIPYLTCATSEDTMPFLLFTMAKNWCDAQKAAGNPDSYCALFARQLPGDNKGAWHSSDLWYAFGTLRNGWRPFEKADYELSEYLVSYYANFVKTGNPNGKGLPDWKPAAKGQKEVMLFDAGKVGMCAPSKLKLLWTTLTTKPVGE